jgi:hypothetical protein
LEEVAGLEVALLEKHGLLPENIMAGSMKWRRGHQANFTRRLPKPLPRFNMYREPVEEYVARIPYKPDVIDLDTCSNRQTVDLLLRRVSKYLGDRGVIIVNVRTAHESTAFIGDPSTIKWWRNAVNTRTHKIVHSEPYPYKNGDGPVLMQARLISYERRQTSA